MTTPTPRTIDLQAIISRSSVNDEREIVQLPTNDFNDLWEFARDAKRDLAAAQSELASVKGHADKAQNVMAKLHGPLLCGKLCPICNWMEAYSAAHPKDAP